MSRPISDILDELDTAAGAMLRVPSAFIALDVLIALRADVVAAIQRPAENIRVIDDIARFLCEILIHMASAGRREDRLRWERAARALHPEVQDDLKRAREEELRQLRDGR